MTRSRDLNRFHRFIAKRRRKALRSSVPGFIEEPLRSLETVNDSQRMKATASERDHLLEFIDTSFDD